MSKRVAVVGAGIVGLSAASALRRAGAEVRCFEKAAPGQAQSVGLTRIFRLAHGEARLVHLAMRAREGWQEWERRWNRRLLGGEGLLITGAELVGLWERALQEAGAPCERLTAEQAHRALPLSGLKDGVLWDPSAGSTRARRAVEALCAELDGCIVPAEVHEMSATSAGMRVRTPFETWECDEVVVAAGIDTPRLAAQVGLALPTELVHASRFTFRWRSAPAATYAPACWIDDSGAYGAGLSSYGQPVGHTGQYAIGVSTGDDGYPGTMDAAEVSRKSLAVSRGYVQAALPELDPEPLSEVQCVHVKMGNADGDGFSAQRRDGATILFGNNLFKFAPLLGDLLCRAAVEGAVPDELRSLETVERGGVA